MAPPPPPPEEIAQLMQFIAEKVTNVKSPMNVAGLCRQFQNETGSSVMLTTLILRINTNRHKIHGMNDFDMETKVRMMFALGASIDAGFLEELKRVADVEVDDQQRIICYNQKDGRLELSGRHSRFPMKMEELRNHAYVEADKEGRITKYKSKNGSLELEGSREMSSIKKSFYSDRWKNICQNIDNDESEENGKEVSNWQKNYEKKLIDLIRFLIESTENAISPLSIVKLAKDYTMEFRSSDKVSNIEARIRNFRQRIHKMNQFDIQTKVKLVFALSASVDADFLKELQENAIVELDEKQRIKKYNANDLSLNLEGDHSFSARIKAGIAERKKRKASVLNDSNHSKDPEFSICQSAVIPKGRKRAREDDEESLKQEDDWSMDFDTNNSDEFDFDPSNYELDMDHLPIYKKPESLMEVKTEESSIVGNHFEENFFDYDLLDYEDEHIPEDKKPESLLEVKTELPEEPSTSNVEYHYEENSEQILIEPKPEIDDK